MIDLNENIRYGIYNTSKKEFQFGICEMTKSKAWKALFNKIGNDARKWRFEVRRIKNGHITNKMINSKCIK